MKIGIIGFGHLGKALTNGLIYKGISSKDNIYVLAKSEKTINIAKNEYGVHVCVNINEIIKESDILFWILPSSSFSIVCDEIIGQDILNKSHVSFMAGVTIAEIKSMIGNVHVTRAMPSIAIEKADGVIGYTETMNEYIDNLFHELGYSFKINENDIEKVTAFAACGLGFAAYILNAFQTTGESLGFSKDISKKIISNTFISAINMGNFAETASAVATSGGATEQGIICFDENNIQDIIDSAVNRAYKKMMD